MKMQFIISILVLTICLMASTTLGSAGIKPDPAGFAIKPNQVAPSSVVLKSSPVEYTSPTLPNSLQQLQQQSLLITINNNPFTKGANDILLDLRQQIMNRRFKFDEQFRSLLQNSRISLHNMFEGTYGILYQRNTEIFTSMFQSLEQYYVNGGIQLHQSMQNFFDELYQKIFQVLNASREYNQDYLKCATEQMSKLKPFKDVPEKLIDDIIRAFVSARTFNQALNRGIDVIRKVISLGQTPVCANLINEKLLANHGQPVCLNYCEQIITKCVGKDSLEKLNENWRAYVVAMDELAFRLSNKYNFEAIISPLDVKISEAIMNFQENGDNITYQVGLICGQQTTASQPMGAVMAASTAINAQSSASGQHHHLRPTTNNNRIRKRATLIAKGGLSAGLATFQRSDRSPTGGATSQLRSSTSSDINRQSNLQPRTFTAANLPPSSSSTVGRYYDVASYNSRSQQQPQHNFRSQPVTFNSAHRSSADAQFDDLSRDDFKLPGGSMRGSEITAVQKRGFKSSTLVDEIRAFMSKTKNFWSSLPNAVCMSNTNNSTANNNNNQSKPLVLVASNAASLNGTTNNKRMQQQQTCFQELITQIGDINNQDYRHKIEISQAVNSLADIKAKIMIALDGKEIEWGPAGMAPTQPFRYPPINLLIPSSTTSSTTQSPSLSSSSSIDDEESDSADDSMDEDNLENSGFPPEDFNNNSDEDQYNGSDIGNLDDSTTQGDFSDNNKDDQLQTKPSLPLETTTNIPLDNSIDRLSADQAQPNSPRGPIGNDLNSQNNNFRFILPPDAQKSSQTSTKLVISNLFNVMLLCFALCSSYMLTCHNQLVLTSGKQNR